MTLSSETVTLMAHTFIGADEAEVRAIVHDPLVAYLRADIELSLAKLARSGGLNVDLDLGGYRGRQADPRRHGV